MTICHSGDVLALTHAGKWLRDLVQPDFGRQRVSSTEHHLFTNPIKNPFRTTGLHLNQENFKTKLTGHLYDEGLPSGFSLTDLALSDPAPPEGVTIRRFGFQYGNWPLCRYEIKTWSFHDGSLPRVSGQFPVDEPGDGFGPHSWPDVEDAFANVTARPEYKDGVASLKRSQQCIFDTDSGWEAVWEILFEVDGLYYLAFADHFSVFRTERKFFTADATLQFYEKNPTSGLKTEVFSLTGDGFLNTEEITTKVQEKSGRAYSKDLNFVRDPDHVDFAEINTFAHILKIQKWFKDLGFEWTKGEVLTLRVHHNSGNNENNGLYLPPEYKGDDSPSITLGDGDGAFLQNLALDRDVASHEFGHHVIYRTLKSTRQEEVRGEPVDSNTDHSGAIHEALADYYIFAMTEDDNACLGESICPGGTHDICYQVGKCLRTARHSLTYDSDDYWDFGRLFHLKSQIVSALLWDIRQDSETDARSFDQLVLKSVPFLKTASNYRDLLIALFSSDKQFYNSQFGCTIESYAKSRGFTALLDGASTSCGVSSGQNIVQREKRCGSIGATGGQSSTPRGMLWILVLLLIPLLSAAPRRTS